MLEKVSMQRTQQFRDFFATERTQLNVARTLGSQKTAIECEIVLSEIRLFLKNHWLELHEIWHENTLGNTLLEY